jgi:hypothetical protein
MRLFLCTFLFYFLFFGLILYERFLCCEDFNFFGPGGKRTAKSLFPLRKWNSICPNGITEKDHPGGVAEPFFLVFIDVKSRSINLNEWTKKKTPQISCFSIENYLLNLIEEKKTNPPKKRIWVELNLMTGREIEDNWWVKMIE